MAKIKINLNPFLQPKDSPFANRPAEVIGYVFDQEYEVQSRTPRFSNLVSISNSGTTGGQIPAGGGVLLTTTLSPAIIHNNDRILAIPFIAIYEGTSSVGSTQFYPAVGSAHTSDPGKFNCRSGYDWGSFDDDNVTWSVTIVNTSGTIADIYAVTQWKYVKNNAGEAG